MGACANFANAVDANFCGLAFVSRAACCASVIGAYQSVLTITPLPAVSGFASIKQADLTEWAVSVNLATGAFVLQANGSIFAVFVAAAISVGAKSSQADLTSTAFLVGGACAADVKSADFARDLSTADTVGVFAAVAFHTGACFA